MIDENARILSLIIRMYESRISFYMWLLRLHVSFYKMWKNSSALLYFSRNAREKVFFKE